MKSLQNLIESGALNQPQQKLAKQLFTRLNRFNHIFNKAEHKLDKFVQSCGNTDKAFDRLDDAFTLAGKGKSDGLFKTVQNVKGFNITLEGSVVNGVPRSATAFIRMR